ncbi:ACT domain-containing protein [Priestia megaterium]|uniref:ACT domain-containing protein n=1 Tax=Priestia TaxID=2800373 RepID=UPI0006ABA732|nr:ACT domain-containing protein [Priestia megaterium]KOP76605.1 ACT domain-containing protein [Bacillus sp. FJAT-21351]KRF57909.1 ACT domain-containing protein [Bacillus sp. Soil531]MBZ5477847.1 ACT domain-containing protein [Bacillus sp. T_4]MBD8842733.1 ACT domain-containing protein [Priestia megaterium]MBU8584502.1 ACT domain-containing protein [Priestia megaterium]
MHKSDKQFYLVREDVLPEAMKKTLDAKLLIERGKAESVADAVQAVDLSRSAFYKYRDTVFPFQTVVKQRIISLFFHIEDRSGTLSHLLSTVASSGCNVLTIHQTIPLQGRANVTLSLDTASMNVELNEMLRRLKNLEFVDKVDVLGSGA